MLDMVNGLDHFIEPVLILPSEGVITDVLKQKGILFYVIPYLNAFEPKGSITDSRSDEIFADNYEAACKIAEIVKEQNISLLHSNSAVVNVGGIAALLAGIPHVWHLRELVEEDFNCDLCDKPLKKRLFQYTDAFLSVSRCVKETYWKRYGICSRQLYDGIDSKRYIRVPGIISNPNPIFLLAGGLYSGKGHWDAIKAVEILIKKGRKEICLILVGDGSQKYAWGMKHYVAEHRLTGNIYFIPMQKDLSVLREKCTFSLTTSKMEALGRVTVEAMLAGNIVIGANTGGTLEIIGTTRERGYVYEQGNAEDLAAVMEEAIGKNCLYHEKMLKNAQKFAIEQFDSKKYAEKVREIYRDVLENNDSKQDGKEEFLKSLHKRYETQKRNPVKKSELPTDNSEKLNQYFRLTDMWLSLKQKGYSLATYFIENNYNKIAIYGMGYLGCILYDDLNGTDITIEYVIDKDKTDLRELITVVSPEEKFYDVDAIVVTIMEDEEEQKAFLKKNCDINQVGLWDVIYWMESFRLRVESENNS